MVPNGYQNRDQRKKLPYMIMVPTPYHPPPPQKTPNNPPNHPPTFPHQKINKCFFMFFDVFDMIMDV